MNATLNKLMFFYCPTSSNKLPKTNKLLCSWNTRAVKPPGTCFQSSHRSDLTLNWILGIRKIRVVDKDHQKMCIEMGMILPSSPSCSLIFFRSEPPTTPTLTRVLSFSRNWAMTGVTTWTHKHDDDSVTEAVAGCHIDCHESLNKPYFCITVL